MKEELSLSVSVSRTVTLGNYNSAQVFVSVSGVKPGMDGAEIQDLVNVEGKIAYRYVAEAVNAKVEQLLQGVLS